MALFQKIYDVNPCQNITDVDRSGWEISGYDDKIFCIYLKENDYLQSFIIALFLIYIHMGTYFVQYPLHAGFYYNLMSMKLRCSIGDMIQEWKHRERIQNQVGFIGGLPVLFYFIINAILHVIYISIKMILITLPVHPNKNFKKMTFAEFNAGARIIGMGFQMHSITSALINLFLLYHSNFGRKYKLWFALLIGLIYASDIIISIIAFSINWSIFLVTLYQVACAILVFIGGILLLCIIGPILYLYVYIIVSLSSCFGCLCSNFDESKPMYIFAITVGGGFASLSILYLCLTASISLSFLFLDGPPGVRLAINFHHGSKDAIVVSLFIIAFFIGVCSIIAGFIFSFLRTNVKSTPKKASVLSTQETRPALDIELEFSGNDTHLIENGLNVSYNEMVHTKPDLIVPETTTLITAERVLSTEST